MKRSIVVGALGTAQTLAWGSSYYLPAILADPIAAGLGLPQVAVFAAFSGALLLAAFLGPAVGRAVDRRGGRGVLALSNLVLAGGLVMLACAQGIAGLIAAWAVLGVGMALGLYDTAFAALAALYGRAARGPITGITLIAGFASTVGWPLSAVFEAHFGWRGACLIWAAMHLVIGLPLNRLLVPAATAAPSRPPEEPREAAAAEPAPRGAMPILAFVFAAAWFVTGGMAAHMPRLLEIAGATPAAALAAAALVGPAQVAARMVEFGLLRLMHPLVSARLATLLHPLGAVLIAFAGPAAIAAFAVLHGAGNGLLTIAKSHGRTWREKAHGDRLGRSARSSINSGRSCDSPARNGGGSAARFGLYRHPRHRAGAEIVLDRFYTRQGFRRTFGDRGLVGVFNHAPEPDIAVAHGDIDQHRVELVLVQQDFHQLVAELAVLGGAGLVYLAKPR